MGGGGRAVSPGVGRSAGGYSGGGYRGGYSGGGARYGSGGSRSGGWVAHGGGTNRSSNGPRYSAGGPRHGGGNPGRGAGHPGTGGRHYGPGYRHYGHGGYRPYYPYWGYGGWAGWGWGWGYAPYWSSWWWGGPWGGTSLYVAPNYVADGSVDVGVRPGRYAVVKTDVTPEEAQVFLDGKYIGSADDFDGFPDFLYLGTGKYHLEFRLPNYQAYATDVEVTRGQQVRVEETLKLEAGKSALDAFPPESKGTPLGRVFTKGGDSAEAAPRGDDGWSDREAPPAYAPRPNTDEDRMDARVEPPPRPSNRGRIKFRVTPDDAAVYMDDKYLGAGDDLAANPRGVVAEPGTHTITVTRPGYKTKTVEVTARAGSPVDVVVELEK